MTYFPARYMQQASTTIQAWTWKKQQAAAATHNHSLLRTGGFHAVHTNIPRAVQPIHGICKREGVIYRYWPTRGSRTQSPFQKQEASRSAPVLLLLLLLSSYCCLQCRQLFLLCLCLCSSSSSSHQSRIIQPSSCPQTLLPW